MLFYFLLMKRKRKRGKNSNRTCLPFSVFVVESSFLVYSCFTLEVSCLFDVICFLFRFMRIIWSFTHTAMDNATKPFVLWWHIYTLFWMMTNCQKQTVSILFCYSINVFFKFFFSFILRELQCNYKFNWNNRVDIGRWMFLWSYGNYYFTQYSTIISIKKKEKRGEFQWWFFPTDSTKPWWTLLTIQPIWEILFSLLFNENTSIKMNVHSHHYYSISSSSSSSSWLWPSWENNSRSFFHNRIQIQTM